jgi:two-component system response regulator PrrA
LTAGPPNLDNSWIVPTLVDKRPTASILIVDDDQSVTDTFARMLRLEGFTVYTALNPETGLELAAQKQPRAIILDLRMPILSGLQFLQLLRAKPHLKDVPVAIVTGDYFVDETVTTQLKALGASVQFKPLWLDDLVSIARTLLAA